MSSPQAIRAMNAAARRHPEARVGDTFGPFTVTATLPRGHKGRSDERVEWACTCGKQGVSFVFNLRKANDTCSHARGKRSPLGKAIEAVAKLDPSPEYVATDYRDLDNACKCCSGGHCPYRMVLHDPATDEPVDKVWAVRQAMIIAEVNDGDEFRIIVVKTGRRPFGDRRMLRVEMRRYARERVTIASAAKAGSR